MADAKSEFSRVNMLKNICEDVHAKVIRKGLKYLLMRVVNANSSTCCENVKINNMR